MSEHGKLCICRECCGGHLVRLRWRTWRLAWPSVWCWIGWHRRWGPVWEPHKEDGSVMCQTCGWVKWSEDDA